ncbi:MAG: tetratricopeptide repeat protein [Bacteroidales bacterium]|nr:tetratricopeptide repeat protein [Candidatus Latescibacterota bacterium]
MGEIDNSEIIDLRERQTRASGSISCCIITRDEDGFISDAIASVKGLADEIIVLDTGSIDETVQCAEKLGARVFTTEWRNDFSEARNLAISKARCEWILILDADEIMDRRSHSRIRELVSGNPDAAFMFEQWTYTDDSDTFGWIPADEDNPVSREMIGYFASQQVRLFRNREDIRYRGQVHEDVEESLLSLDLTIFKVEDVIVHHYGRLKDSERIDRKYRMYLDLGEKKLQANPGNSKYIFELASQLLGLGFTEESMVQIDRGLEIAPDSWEFLNLKGLTLIKQGASAESVEYFSRGIEIDGSRPDLYNNIGVALIESMRPEAALEQLLKGLEISADNPNLLRNSATACIMSDRLDDGRSYIERSLAVDPFMSHSHMIHADILFRTGKNDEAAEALEKIRFISGTDLKVYLKSVYIYSQMKMVDRASDVVGRALKDYPGHEGLIFLSGKVHELKEEFETAITIYNELLTRSPNNSDIHNSLGCMYEKRGELKKAAASFDRAARLSPHNLQIRINLGIVEGKLGRDTEAEEHLRSVLSLDPLSGSALNAFGCFLSQRGRYSEAIKNFTKAIEQDPGDIRFYLNLGLLCEKMEMPVRAAEIYEKIAMLDPSAAPIVESRLEQLRDTVS